MSRCENCRFSRKHESALECHKNPPPWHPVAYGDWCSFWEVNDNSDGPGSFDKKGYRARKGKHVSGSD